MQPGHRHQGQSQPEGGTQPLPPAAPDQAYHRAENVSGDLDGQVQGHLADRDEVRPDLFFAQWVREDLAEPAPGAAPSRATQLEERVEAGLAPRCGQVRPSSSRACSRSA